MKKKSEADLILEAIKELEKAGYEVSSRYGDSEATKKELKRRSPR